MPTARTLPVGRGHHALLEQGASGPANALYHLYPLLAQHYWAALGWLLEHYRQAFHDGTPHWPRDCIDPVSRHYQKLLALSEQPQARPQLALQHLGCNFFLGPSPLLRLDDGMPAPSSLSAWQLDCFHALARRLDALVQFSPVFQPRRELLVDDLAQLLTMLAPVAARAALGPHPFHSSDWLAVVQPGQTLCYRQLLDSSHRQKLRRLERDPAGRKQLCYYRLDWRPQGGALAYCRLRRANEAVPTASFGVSPCH
ncbi:hypothetical protein PVT67_14585 [Gallaecimonas kandeliae]|uniref:hypothetical protein n=1 Tax=Gallaecimonas kandeliae TaxID=3029055 RepID=UPI002649790E|nr:hypothetical protein [Gallaecimonas kandeliae]WKE64881.1 hypothetical protein PVT67_14585 [Gallaecimonas kandeliae]